MYITFSLLLGCTCIPVYMYTSKHIYKYAYVHIYIYTYMHIYTNSVLLGCAVETILLDVGFVSAFVAECCSVLQCVAVYRSVLHCVVVFCSVVLGCAVERVEMSVCFTMCVAVCRAECSLTTIHGTHLIHCHMIYTHTDNTLPCGIQTHRHTDTQTIHCYGVATISRLLKIIGLFCRISSLL